MRFILLLLFISSSASAGYVWRNNWGFNASSDTYQAEQVGEKRDENGKVTVTYYSGDSLRGEACSQAKERVNKKMNDFIANGSFSSLILAFKPVVSQCKHQGEKGRKTSPYPVSEMVDGHIKVLQYVADSSPADLTDADKTCAALPPFSGALEMYGKGGDYVFGIDKKNGCLYQSPKTDTQCGAVPGSVVWCNAHKWEPVLSVPENEPDPCDTSDRCGLPDDTGDTGDTGGSGGDTGDTGDTGGSGGDTGDTGGTGGSGGDTGDTGGTGGSGGDTGGTGGTGGSGGDTGDTGGTGGSGGGTGGTGGTGGSGGGTGGTGGTGDCGGGPQVDSNGSFLFYYDKMACKNKKELTETYNDSEVKQRIKSDLDKSADELDVVINKHTNGIMGVVNGNAASSEFSGAAQSMKEIGSGKESPVVNKFLADGVVPKIPAYSQCKPLLFGVGTVYEFTINCDKINLIRSLLSFIFYFFTFMSVYNNFTFILKRGGK
ncbi:hypothetical protein ABG149_004801 [Salmonella enterica]